MKLNYGGYFYRRRRAEAPYAEYAQPYTDARRSDRM